MRKSLAAFATTGLLAAAVSVAVTPASADPAHLPGGPCLQPDQNVSLSSVAGYDDVVARHPKAAHPRGFGHLGTLGTGNHFIEICLDTEQRVWVMLHSGSRGVGNAIGTFFIELAKQDMRKWFLNLPDEDRYLKTREELIELFSLDRITGKSAVFDTQKLEWLNGQHLSRMSGEELAELARPLFLEAGVAPVMSLSSSSKV